MLKKTQKAKRMTFSNAQGLAPMDIWRHQDTHDLWSLTFPPDSTSHHCTSLSKQPSARNLARVSAHNGIPFSIGTTRSLRSSSKWEQNKTAGLTISDLPFPKEEHARRKCASGLLGKIEFKLNSSNADHLWGLLPVHRLKDENIKSNTPTREIHQ